MGQAVRRVAFRSSGGGGGGGDEGWHCNDGLAWTLRPDGNGDGGAWKDGGGVNSPGGGDASASAVALGDLPGKAAGAGSCSSTSQVVQSSADESFTTSQDTTAFCGAAAVATTGLLGATALVATDWRGGGAGPATAGRAGLLAAGPECSGFSPLRRCVRDDTEHQSSRHSHQSSSSPGTMLPLCSALGEEGPCSESASSSVSCDNAS
mmetsp:Transcript_93333/g.207626  ORF Transcript_93333/g.207626 Transcript_93333/m.207626 type:complete len:207 (+) Transcript_93333:802-1422(+)